MYACMSIITKCVTELEKGCGEIRSKEALKLIIFIVFIKENWGAVTQ